MNADQILVLQDGRITQRGTHRELTQQEGLYKQIYELQAKIESEVERENRRKLARISRKTCT